MIVNNIAHQVMIEDSKFHGLPIMCSAKSPCYVEIIEKAYRELTLLSARYGEILVVRLDFKLSDYGYASKVDISKFRKSFIRKLETRFGSKVGYQWIREYGKSNTRNPTHWHWWVAVKASKVNKPNVQSKKILIMARDAWVIHTGTDKSRVNKAGYFFLARKCFSLEGRKLQQSIIANGPSENESDVLINRKVIATRETSNIVLGGALDECFFTLSYMAKVFTKTSTPNTKGKRVFSNSKLNTKDRRAGRQETIEENLSQIHEWLEEPLDTMPLTYKTKVRIKKKKGDSELLIAL